MGANFQASFSESVDNFSDDMATMFKKPSLVVSNYSWPSFFVLGVILLTDIYLPNKVNIGYILEVIALLIIFVADQFMYCKEKGFTKPDFNALLKDGTVTVLPVWIIVILIKSGLDSVAASRGNTLKKLTINFVMSIVLFLLYNWTSNFRKAFGYDVCETVTDLDIQRSMHEDNLKKIVADKYKMFQKTDAQKTYEDINKTKSTSIITTTILSTDGGLVPTNLAVTSNKEKFEHTAAEAALYKKKRDEETKRFNPKKQPLDNGEYFMILTGVGFLLFFFLWVLRKLHPKIIEKINKAKKKEKKPNQWTQEAVAKENTKQMEALSKNISALTSALRRGNN